MQFAGATQGGDGGNGGDPSPSGGTRPDPIQALDKNGDGHVGADEFGRSSSSDDVKKLYAAIDSSGDGSLSSDEITTFRDQMTQADGQAAPDRDAGRSGGFGPPSADASAFLQRLATRYLSMTGASIDGTTASSSSLSVTA